MIKGPSIGQVIEGIGKEAIGIIFDLMTEEHHSLYSAYLGRNRHLDIGSGDGSTALHIRKSHPDLTVQMLDIYDTDLSDAVRQRISGDPQLNFTLYPAGSPMPFQDNTFGSSALFYVLHHCSRDVGLDLLKEARRVTKNDGHVLMLEETWKTPDERESLMEMDITTYRMFYPSIFTEEGLGYDNPEFFTEPELIDTFRNAGLKVKEAIKPKFRYDLFPRTLYILGSDSRG